MAMVDPDPTLSDSGPGEDSATEFRGAEDGVICGLPNPDFRADGGRSAVAAGATESHSSSA